MHIGIAILTDVRIHNIARNITFNLNSKYNTGIESALLPQHISLKQSFPYEGDIGKMEEFIERFCSKLKPFKLFAEKVEINSFGEENILAWLKIRESQELRCIHTKLCEELKSEFKIEPLGFDGEKWKFHSTLVSCNIDKLSKNDLICEYDKKEVLAEFEARKVVMFCNMGDGRKTSEYFSLKIFDIGNM